MTTRVTVDAHAGWDVRVLLTNPALEGAPKTEQVVKAGTTQDFYIYDTQNIVLVEEIKKGQ